ncbi:MAG TPA: squalene/phytoene synthase family protein [Steroidobacteraceae bacterium]
MDDPLKRGTPPGSLRDFAVTYAPPHAKPLLDALYAFEAEIDDTVRASSHEVAHTRLQWWRGEIDRLLGGNAQHPVTRALGPLRATAGTDLALLHEALVAADIELARLTFGSASELEAYCYRASGSLQTLAAIACAARQDLSDREREFARRLGSAVKQTELLRDLRQHATAGRLPLALDELDAAGVDPRDLLAEPLPPALARLLETRRLALRNDLQQLPALLDPAEQRSQRQGLVLAALHAKLLERIDHRRELARTRAEVAPSTRLWTAWRTALRHA